MTEEQPVAVIDLAIVGAGPAGLSASIYTTREDISTTLYEKSVVGGLAAITDVVENYPGFIDGISGYDLSEQMHKQALRFGAKFQTGVGVEKIEREGKLLKLTTSTGEVLARSVLIATGSGYKHLDVPGENEYLSRGVHYCATCDGPLYRDKPLVVVGGGNSALQESLFLAKFASRIDLLVRGTELKGSEILQREVEANEKITIHYQVSVTEIVGESNRVKAVLARDAASNSDITFDVTGIFIFIGLLPNTTWAQGIVDLDERGLIITNERLQTSMPGVYAAGDVRSGATLQIASAVGEGATAALMIREYLGEVS